MRLKTAHLYWIIFIVHVIIAVVAFWPFFHHPGGILLSQWDDGLKNMFTLYSYVKEPVTTEGILKFNSFCYPFGDYVFYTDNTPLFSVLFRWFCNHIADISRYTIPVFQGFIISNIAVAGLLVFYFFRRLLGESIFSFVLAIVLPWTNVQVLRILRGHFNLSLSSFTIGTFCLLLAWHSFKSSRGRQFGVLMALALLTILSFLAHPYYLPLFIIFIMSSLVVYGLLNLKKSFGRNALLSSVIYLVVSVVISAGILIANDSYLPLRKVKANGYDWMEQKLRFSYLFSHYYFQKLYLPIPGILPDQVDKPGFLGNIGVVSLLTIIVLFLFHGPTRKKIIAIQSRFFKDPVTASIFIGSFIMLTISFGEVYYTATPYEKGIRLINLLNPLLYIHFITNRVEQFRFLERFMWPFYFGFYAWIMFIVTALYKDAGKYARIATLSGLIILGSAELFDFAKEIKRQMIQENTLNEDYVKRLLPVNLHPDEFQAILPLPFYFTGAEDSLYNFNIDGDPDWVSQTYSISAGTHLPLMSSYMSRTPILFAAILMNFAAYDSLDEQLRKRLNNKPILVVEEKNLVNNRNARGIPENKLDADLYWGAARFAKRNQLKAFDSMGNVLFFKWYPPTNLKK